MITIWYENVFRKAGPLWGKFTGQKWITPTKAIDMELLLLVWVSC